MSTTPTPPPALQVAEIERHLRWRVLPTVMFIALLSALAVCAYVSVTVPPRHPRGLPDEPRAQQAFALLAGRVGAETGALRWRSTVLGGEPARAAATPASLGDVREARPRLAEVAAKDWLDPRPLAALAALDLVEHREAAAARRYRHACELAPHYGEARLGAGVALALLAERTSDPWQSRALRLQAAAQFAAVDSVDAEYPLALFDRALVLRDVGRPREAEVEARRYLALDSTSAWARSLRAGAPADPVPRR